jgi:hypothetical protein
VNFSLGANVDAAGRFVEDYCIPVKLIDLVVPRLFSRRELLGPESANRRLAW